MSVETAQTLQLVKDALAKSDDALAKSISQATGLVAFDLQKPAKNLYPVNTPVRNRLPRVKGDGGVATNWRQVSAIIGSGFDGSGWVPEGQRSARMSYTTATKAATYVTLGEEDQVSFEARNAGEGFEDIQANMTMRLLQKMMLKEESALLGGNASLALGTTPTPTTAVGGAGGTLPTLTYDVACVALTMEGYRNTALNAAGVVGSAVITGADGLTFTLNGGSAQKSAVATQAVTLGQVLSVSVAAVRGAVAYAWYVGGAGVSRLEAITFINSATFSAPLAGTFQLLSALPAADNSRNASLAYDGLITAALNVANGAYFASMPTGTPGTGTPLTAGTRGNVIEIDNMLIQLWNQFQVSPTVIFCNAQEIRNITTKVLAGSGSAPLLQYFASPSDGMRTLIGGGGIDFYYNPFAMGSGYKIPILIHPNVPAGTLVGWCENLPAQYQSNNVPNVAEVKCRKDYYQVEWPLRTRQQEVGVYAEAVLAIYAPFAIGVITNIGNG